MVMNVPSSIELQVILKEGTIWGILKQHLVFMKLTLEDFVLKMEYIVHLLMEIQICAIQYMTYGT